MRPYVLFALVVLASAVAAELGRAALDGAPPPLVGRVAAARSPQQEEFRWSGRVAAGATVEIVGLMGGITAGPARGELVEVSAVKRGRRSRPQDVRIDVVEHAGGVTICALYPAPDGERENECRPGGAARTRTRKNDVSVTFEIRVPAGAQLVARNVNGGIRAEGLAADVEAHTVNGAVTLGTRGTTTAETVNGEIVASAGALDGSESIELRTVNGGIRLTLPRGIGADLDASTVNGWIHSDFPIDVRGRVGGGRLRAASRAVRLDADDDALSEARRRPPMPSQRPGLT